MQNKIENTFSMYQSIIYNFTTVDNKIIVCIVTIKKFRIMRLPSAPRNLKKHLPQFWWKVYSFKQIPILLILIIKYKKGTTNTQKGQNIFTWEWNKSIVHFPPHPYPWPQFWWKVHSSGYLTKAIWWHHLTEWAVGCHWYQWHWQ